MSYKTPFLLLQYTLKVTVDPTNAQVTDKAGAVTFTPVDGQDGQFTAPVEYEQQITVVSTLVGYDEIERVVTIEAANKDESITMTKSQVRLL